MADDITRDPAARPSPEPSPYIHAAEIRLAPDVDSSAIGAAVTGELCGHWQHDGACRWPHNNAVEGDAIVQFRVLFLADEADELEVRGRIEKALRTAPGWSVVASSPRRLRAGERALAARLSRATS